MKYSTVPIGPYELNVNPLLFALCAYIVIRILAFALRKFLQKTRIDPVVHSFLVKSFKTVAYIIIFFIVLNMYGIDTRGFMTVLGVSGAAIALALRDSLGNVAGGMLILFSKPFSEHDWIEISEFSGSVKEVNILNTVLIDEKGKEVIVPNGNMSTEVLVNHSRKHDLLNKKPDE